jgi:hypothetical protein
MKKVSLSLLVVLLLSLWPAVTALATPPEDVSGAFELIEGTEDIEVFNVTGVFCGQAVEYLTTGKSHRLVCEDCEVNGKHGTIVFDLVTLNYRQNRGHLTVLSATGELTGLHFQGQFAATTETTGTYWGQIHFDPE